MRALHKVVGLLIWAGVCHAALATTVESFSPQGIVKGVRQVQARFTDQIVPFGDLRLADPFTVTCPEKGTGRWVDGKNWSYDFDRDLPAGVNCRFVLKADLKDLSGKPITGEQSYAFSTGGPAIVESVPSEGQWYLDENQIFILGLDAVAKEGTIENHVHCAAAGVNEKIGVRLIKGKQRDELLALRRKFIDRYLTIYFKARGGIWKTTLALNNKRIDKLPLAILQCKQTLPAESEIKLVWGAGVASESGVASAEDQTLAFKTRPNFSAKFSCTRTNPKAQCIPFLPMSLGFTAPIRMTDAKAITLTGSDGKVHQPVISKNEVKNEYVTGLSFNGPFPENSVFTLAVPDKLKDDAGRSLINQQSFQL